MTHIVRSSIDGERKLSAQTISLPDGRQLGYLIIGKGEPVVYFHGTASSRLEILLLKELACAERLQIIGIDRPGYGLSTFKRRKNLQDFNANVNFLTDYLGIERFGILGWSGGGVFALAYLALFPKRVTKAVIAGAPALPFDVSTAHNMPFARYVMKIPYVGYLAMRQLSRQLLKANGDTAKFLATRQGKQLLRGYSTSDLTFFSNPEWMQLMYQSMAEAFRRGNQGVNAVVAEHQIFMKPWNISFTRISADKLFVWHGTDDKTCRVSNAYQISKIIPLANLEIFPAKGHCVMFENLKKLGEILRSID
jgi:pimeloyl-ACP methyl ester carboxylesterase